MTQVSNNYDLEELTMVFAENIIDLVRQRIVERLKNKLRAVLSPNKNKCFSLLRKSGKEKMIYLDNLRKKLEYKRKSNN